LLGNQYHITGEWATFEEEELGRVMKNSMKGAQQVGNKVVVFEGKRNYFVELEVAVVAVVVAAAAAVVVVAVVAVVAVVDCTAIVVTVSIAGFWS